MKTPHPFSIAILFLLAASSACLSQSVSPQVQKKLDDLNAKRVYYEKLEQAYRDSAAMIEKEIDKLAPQQTYQSRSTTVPAASLAPAGSTSSSNQLSSGSSSRTSTKSTGSCGTVQCSGNTQKGNRCRNKTTNCNGRCHLH